jgi:fluoride exporter
MITSFIWVGLGGALGSMARYACQRSLASLWPGSFPAGTFAVNILGCFLIGVIWGLSIKSFHENVNWKLFLMTGLLGGFTTFSAFTLESVGLLREQKNLLFILYTAGSITGGLLATYAGMKISRLH